MKNPKRRIEIKRNDRKAIKIRIIILRRDDIEFEIRKTDRKKEKKEDKCGRFRVDQMQSLTSSIYSLST